MFTAAGKSAAVSAANYIEEVFSTYLYTGTGATQTITNGIDLSGKGGLVWLKKRSSATGGSHRLMDTVRGGNKLLSSNTTGAESTSNQVTFLSSGFDVIDAVDNGATYVSWTFREQAKFFDIVTYTGDAVAGRQITHNLASVPGCIIVKALNTAGYDWFTYHRSASGYLRLNTTDAATANNGPFNNQTPTSSVFYLNGTGWGTNDSGVTYVAYLFAHDAGGFGATGSDNVISCGSFTSNASGSFTAVNLGYEPQWLLFKRTDSATNGGWILLDNMRGFAQTGNKYLEAQTTAAESAGYQVVPLSTGFGDPNNSGPLSASATYIYIAIRRGPMKTPTSGTSVYENTAYTGNNTAQRQIGSTVLLDALLLSNPSANATGWASYAHYVFDRLRGNNVALSTTFTSAEVGGWSTYIEFDKNIGWDTSSTTSQGYLNNTGSTFVSHTFSRAPGFFDVVCYTGTGANRTLNHNLGVVPEMMIVKVRSGTTDNWWVYDAATGNTKYQALNTTAVPVTSSTAWNNTTPTSSVFTVGTGAGVNGSTFLYVAYLFASCPGVSKVGSYTGTGALQTVNCGFSSGARFVLIKRTDSTGDWYLYNSASGITSGNDPYVLLNSAAAEVTSTNYVDTASTGFQVTAAAPAGLNANGGTYIFLAIA